MSDHRHIWEKAVSSSADSTSIEYACTVTGCTATKTEFEKHRGPAVAEDRPAEPRRVFGSAGEGAATFIEPE